MKGVKTMGSIGCLSSLMQFGAKSVPVCPGAKRALNHSNEIIIDGGWNSVIQYGHHTASDRPDGIPDVITAHY